jgi:DNA helicase II / ATP-dependent DNA helicase PcrA
MNPVQAILQESNPKRHHAIAAVAGSGKTSTLIDLCRHLGPDRKVRFLAFNRHIAQELKTRLPKTVRVQTTHALGLELVRKHLRRELVTEESKYSDWIRKGIEEVKGKGTFFKRPVSLSARGYVRDLDSVMLGYFRKDLREIFNFVVNQHPQPNSEDVSFALFRMGKVLPIDHEELAVWFGRLVDAGIWDATENGRLGFLDMILLPARFELKPDRCDDLLVDEFQDLTPLQFSLVKSFVTKGARLVAVADPKQAIYGFAGAGGDSLDWIKALPEGVSEHSLPFTWRCAKSIVRKANEIVPWIQAAAQAPEGLVEEVDDEQLIAGVAPGDLVLSRTNAPLVRVFLRLIERKVPVLLRGNEIEEALIRALTEIGSLPGFLMSGFASFVEEWVSLKIDGVNNTKVGHTIRDVATAAKLCQKTFRSSSMFGLIDQVKLVFGKARQSESDRRIADDVICLSSIHRAKGLEAKTVWVLDGTELPLREPDMLAHEIEAEENVAYVAMTRARTRLFLVKPRPDGEES